MRKWLSSAAKTELVSREPFFLSGLMQCLGKCSVCLVGPHSSSIPFSRPSQSWERGNGHFCGFRDDSKSAGFCAEAAARNACRQTYRSCAGTNQPRNFVFAGGPNNGPQIIPPSPLTSVLMRWATILALDVHLATRN